MNWSVRRINKLANFTHAENYLEVGVETGSTFLNVNIQNKDAVDPNFRFDTKYYANEATRFFHMPSDEFWTSTHPKPYDIIFLDGLHTFEQTFRDFVCSMKFSHLGTVWVIDDVLPSDVFSAIPNQRRSLYERKLQNIDGTPWHGDVFKIMLAICDFFPIFSYATIINSGNPQALVWHASRVEFAPKANNFEKISRMTFFDIRPNIAIFQLMAEDDAFDALEKSYLKKGG